MKNVQRDPVYIEITRKILPRYRRLSNRTFDNITVNGVSLDTSNLVVKADIKGLGELTDPLSDRMLYWDDANKKLGWLGAGNHLEISAGQLNHLPPGTPSTVSVSPGQYITGINKDVYGHVTGFNESLLTLNLNISGTTGTGQVDIATETLSIIGGTGVDTVVSGQTVTINTALLNTGNADEIPFVNTLEDGFEYTENFKFDGDSLIVRSSTNTSNVLIGSGLVSTLDAGAASNTAVGVAALASLVDGVHNTALGTNAANKVSTGEHNTMVGSAAGFYISTGNRNAIFGRLAGYGSSGNSLGVSYTALFGMYAGYANEANAISAFGYGAMFNNTTGATSAAFGYFALRFNQTGTTNSAFGYQAATGTTGQSYSSNSAFGYRSLYEGYGNSNSGFGAYSGYSLTTGAHNTFIGRYSGFGITTGSFNTILQPNDASALGTGIITGSYNTILGYVTGLSDQSNAIVIADGEGNIRQQYDATNEVWTLDGQDFTLTGGTSSDPALNFIDNTFRIRTLGTHLDYTSPQLHRFYGNGIQITTGGFLRLENASNNSFLEFKNTGATGVAKLSIEAPLGTEVASYDEATTTWDFSNALKLSSYGVQTYTGTPAYLLAVTATGDVIESEFISGNDNEIPFINDAETGFEYNPLFTLNGSVFTSPYYTQVGVGVASGAQVSHFSHSRTGEARHRFENPSTGTSASVSHYLTADTDNLIIRQYGSFNANTDFVSEFPLATAGRIAATGSGLVLHASDTTGKILFGTNNTEAMRIDENQHIGIGTDTPAYRLHVYTEAGSETAAMFESDSASNVGIRLSNTSAGGLEWAFASLGTNHPDGSGKLKIKVVGASADILNLDGVNNRIGIMNVTPLYPLHISGNTYIEGGDLWVGAVSNWPSLTRNINVQSDNIGDSAGLTFRVHDGTNNIRSAFYVSHSETSVIWDSTWSTGFSGVDMRIAGVSAIHISAGRKVGINKVGAAYELDVTGDGRFTDTLHLNQGAETTYDIARPDSEISLILGQNIASQDRGYMKLWGTTLNAYGVVQMTTKNLHIDSGAGGKTLVEYYNGGDVILGNNSWSGKVGIGDTTPSYTLDVAGDGRFTSTLRAEGNLTITKDGGTESVFAIITGDAGYNRAVSFRTGSSQRWLTGINVTAETGSNAGSDFAINRYADDGSLIDSAISILRASGRVTVNNQLKVGDLTTNVPTDRLLGHVSGSLGEVTLDSNTLQLSGGQLSVISTVLPDYGTDGQIPYMNATGDAFIYDNSPTISTTGALTVTGRGIYNPTIDNTYAADLDWSDRTIDSLVVENLHDDELAGTYSSIYMRARGAGDFVTRLISKVDASGQGEFVIQTRYGGSAGVGFTSEAVKIKSGGGVANVSIPNGDLNIGSTGNWKSLSKYANIRLDDDSGIIGLSLQSANGTKNFRTALFQDSANNQIGIDVNWSSGNPDFVIQKAGVNSLVIDSSQDVSIPNGSLSITDNGNLISLNDITYTGGGNTRIDFNDQVGTRLGYVGTVSGGAHLYLQTDQSSNASIFLRTNGTNTAMELDENQNVSIPNGTLTVGSVTYPNSHGSNGQTLYTTGSGTLAFRNAITSGTVTGTNVTSGSVTYTGSTGVLDIVVNVNPPSGSLQDLDSVLTQGDTAGQNMLLNSSSYNEHYQLDRGVYGNYSLTATQAVTGDTGDGLLVANDSSTGWIIRTRNASGTTKDIWFSKDGSQGIGNPTMSHMLNVKGDSGAVGQIGIYQSGSYSGMQFFNGSNAHLGYIISNGITSAGNGNFYSGGITMVSDSGPSTIASRGHHLQFYTRNSVSADIQRMTITDTDGFVGINNTSPNYRLDVYGETNQVVNINSNQSSTYIRMQASGTTSGYFYGSNSGEVGILDNAGSWAVRVGSGGNLVSIQDSGTAYIGFERRASRARLIVGSNDASTLWDATNRALLLIDGTSAGSTSMLGFSQAGSGRAYFFADTTFRMIAAGNRDIILTSETASTSVGLLVDGDNGYVSIGGGTPAYQLDVTGNIYATSWIRTSTGFYSQDNGGYLRENTYSTYTPWAFGGNQKGSWSGFMLYDSTDASSPTQNMVHMMYRQNEGDGGIYVEAGKTNGSLWFLYWNEVNGCVGIGGSSTSSTYSLYVTGEAYSTVDFTTASDERLKTHIDDIPEALSILPHIKAYRYKKGGKQEIGYGAQTLNKYISDPVKFDKENDVYGVSYNQMSAFNTRALQQFYDLVMGEEGHIPEHERRIKELEKRVEELESQLEER